MTWTDVFQWLVLIVGSVAGVGIIVAVVFTSINDDLRKRNK
jgi:hypothetical protein